MAVNLSKDLIGYLKNTLPSLPIVSINALSKTAIKKSYVPKKVLVPIGYQWVNVWWITKGVLRLYYIDKNGNEFNKAFFSEGELVFPVASLAQDKPSIFVIETIEPVEVLEWKFKVFKNVFERELLWEKFCLPFAQKLADVKFIREWEFLTLDARSRYERLKEQHPEIVNRLPDNMLASYIGITPVSLSRLKRNL